MKHLKLFENFRQEEEVTEFMSIIKEKVLELADLGFKVKVEDKTSEPNLENMINIGIKNEATDKWGNTQPFKFSEVSDVIAEILLLNIEWLKTEPLYKQTHVFVRIAGKVYMIKGYEQRTENNGVRGERISYTLIDEKIQWRFENPEAVGRKTFYSTEGNPLNLDCKHVELFFE